MDEMPIEVCEAEEGLDVLNLTGLRPILDGLDLLHGHNKSSRRQDISKIFYGVHMEFTLLGVGIESMSMQSSQTCSSWEALSLE